MLTDKKYKELALSILESADPVLAMLEAERDILIENPDLWQIISLVIEKEKEGQRVAELLPGRFDPILKAIEVFRQSKWNRDEKIPSELFKMDHLFFFVHSGKEGFDPPKDKVLVGLGYEFTMNVMEDLRPFKPSKEEFDFFKGAFNGRYPAREYCEELDAGTSGTLDKIFQRPLSLRPELKDYYFTMIRADIIDYLSGRKDRQMDFQRVFDERLKREIETKSHSGINLLDRSGIKLNRDKSGAKTELLRVLDALYELRFFTNDDGQMATKESVMKAFGDFLGDDFSTFSNVLSQSYINTKVETNLAIFDQMRAKIQSKCISKT